MPFVSATLLSLGIGVVTDFLPAMPCFALTHSSFAAFMLLSLTLGLIAALADILGGLVLVRRHWEKRYLRYFVALGAGFMLSVAFLEMIPESLHFSARWSPALVLAGYCAIHLIEHTITPHFHFGEETHHGELSARTGYSVLTGLAIHALFDGVAIGSGFVLSTWLGWLIFFAVFLHKMPEGFTVASVMLASGRSRAAALISASVLAAATLLGVLIINLLPGWVYAGLPLSAGVAIYVGATDLVPEVNREPGIRMALVFFTGVVLFLLLKMLVPSL
jgi:zinc transporter ZupT